MNKWNPTTVVDAINDCAIDTTTIALFNDNVKLVWMSRTLHEFKDWNALMLELHSGTAKRISQAPAAAEAVAQEWAMAASGIRKAHFQGNGCGGLAIETVGPRCCSHVKLRREATAGPKITKNYEDFVWLEKIPNGVTQTWRESCQEVLQM